VILIVFYLCFCSGVVYLCCSSFLVLVLYLFTIFCCNTAVVYLPDNSLSYNKYITNSHGCRQGMIKYIIKIRIFFIFILLNRDVI